MEIVKHLFLLFFSSYVIWKVCDSFQQASIFLGRNMPKGARGATINAIGSSFPEFMTSFVAIFEYSKNDGAMFGISNTTGSVIYNISVIPFFIIFACLFYKNIKKLKFDKFILIRDSMFLIFTQLYLMLVLSNGKITIWDSLILIAFYILYLVVIFNYPKHKKNETNEGNDLDFSLKAQENLIRSFIDIDLFSIFFKKTKKQNLLNSFVIIFISIVIFYFMCDILVSSSYAISNLLHIPSYFVAMTVTAFATSVPDTILSIKDAKMNNFDDAITNAFGSNIFNISFCIGFPILLYNILNNSDLLLSYGSVESINHLKNISIFLVLFVVFIFVIKRINWILKGILLLLTYIMFLIYVMFSIDNLKDKPNNNVMQHHHHLANYPS